MEEASLFDWHQRNHEHVLKVLELIVDEQKKGFKKMSDQSTALTQAVTDLKASFSAELAAILAKLNTSDPQVAQAIVDLQTLKASVDSETGTLTT